MIHLKRDQLELFIDRYLIDTLDGVRMQLHRPHSAGPVLQFDKPWEGGGSFYHTAIQDGDRYRIYYRGWAPPFNNDDAVTCLIESDDGITWHRPDVGLHEMHGTKANNVLLVGADATHNFAPFLDDRPGVPRDQRYKAMAQWLIAETKREVLIRYASADGLRWAPISEKPALTEGAFDSLNVPFWSEHEQCYLCYFRSWTGATKESMYGGIRTISRSRSEDFVHWDAPEQMTYGDAPKEQFYTNGTQPYSRAPHIYIALPKRFVPTRRWLTDEQAARINICKTQLKGVSDTVLMTSRGGTTYDRTFLDGFITAGPDIGNWGARSNGASSGILQTSDTELSIYVVRHYSQPSIFLERMTLRLDGFASLRGDRAGGTATTKSLKFDGQQLLINYATSAAGSVRVAVLDEQGAAIEGYSFDDCGEMFGDAIEQAVSWAGKDLSALRGRAVKLAFELCDADVYALRVR